MKIAVAYLSDNSQTETGLNIMIWPDSAMIRTGKPVFLPEGELRLMPGFVARVKAVGKSIRSRFAKRYYYEIAPSAFILPSGTADKIERHNDPAACEIISDYSMICGDFIPCDAVETGKEYTVDISFLPLSGAEKESFVNFNIVDIEGHINDAIVTASIRNTLKTGDLVGFILDKSYKVTPETLLKISLDGDILIENKLK